MILKKRREVYEVLYEVLREWCLSIPVDVDKHDVMSTLGGVNALYRAIVRIPLPRRKTRKLIVALTRFHGHFSGVGSARASIRLALRDLIGELEKRVVAKKSKRAS